MLDNKWWDPSKKIVNHTKLEDTSHIFQALSEEQLEMFGDSIFGQLLLVRQIPNDNKTHSTYPSRIVHQLILRQCINTDYTVKKVDGKVTPCEAWFKINNHVVKFGLSEFALMTGLNCREFTPDELEEHNRARDYTPKSMFANKFFKKMKKVSTLEVVAAFLGARDATNNEKVMLAKLVFLETILLPKQERSSINTRHLDIADNSETFDNYPWGRVSYEKLIESITNCGDSLQKITTGYGVHGFSHALVAWAYEILPSLAENQYGICRNPNATPRILRWQFLYQGRFNSKGLVENVFENSKVNNIYRDS